MTEQTEITQALPGRRHVVRGVGAAGVALAAAGGLAACGDDSSDSGSTGGGGSAPAGSGAGSSATSSAGAADGVSVPTSKVPVGGGFIDAKAKVVVTQPEQGTYKAFSAVCTHQGCSVNKVENKQIMCPCHGSVFDASTGDVVDGPAQKPLPSKTATLQGAAVVIT
ncbi:Rieske (2Fe-2S) protein [Luteipulveratus mongoliensis]|uniref:Cytochrome bc1 complex Rieske iron-sulfur subunit n=1 Tax=Luteipulveratus mongoliensis TaxID=571913 RepID=A0A0K1JJC4_9MICO|nr:Rieske (2Fe-2S) protein [Luteipulveratus mongoliensis]AKU16801.1 hypothetical protein VV02_14525 [Luteipulveratus mongoliensis]